MKKKQASDPTHIGNDLEIDVSNQSYRIKVGLNTLKREFQEITLTGESAPYSQTISFLNDYEDVPIVSLTGKRLGDNPGQAIKAEIEEGTLDTDGCTVLGSENAEVMVTVTGID